MAKGKAGASGGGAAPQAPTALDARLQQALAAHQQGRLELARAGYEEILRAQPQHCEALHLLGVLALQQKDAHKALALIGRALEIRPDYAEAWSSHGNGLVDLKRLDEALASYDRAVALEPDFAGAWSNRGNVLMVLKRTGEALASFDRAIALKPDHALAWSNRGSALKDLNRPDEALASYDRAIALNPDFVEAWSNRGHALVECKRLEEALAAYERVTKLRPDHVGAWFGRANALACLGRLEEALACYERVISIEPDRVEVWCRLGNALKHLKRPEQALASFERAIALSPQYAEAWSNRGATLADLARLEEALASFERAIALDSGLAGAWSNRGNTLAYLNRADEALASHEKALALDPDLAEARSNLLLALNYSDRLARAEVFEEHLAWSRRHEAPLAAQRRAHANSRDPQRRLRVGYVSPDFRRHSVAFFIEPLLARHDREAFEVYCYSNVLHPDPVTQRLLALADGARDIVGLSDAQAAEQVRADGIDLLVDLAGHTARGRLGIFALKPAPVQASYLGYPNTTGLAAIDWRLTDRYADPPGESEAFHSERLARLPHTFLCFRPPPEAPQIEPPPCLAQGHITFGSFNAHPKVTEEVIRTWARLMERVPGSRLMLKGLGLGDALLRARLFEAFARHGIGGERLMLLPMESDFRMHLARYHEVDIGLDPFPYNGTTTTCEALWMGVPVVSLAGQRHAGRVGASILANLGLEELLAQDVEDYIARAAALAADGARLAALRSTMRERVAASPLRDETAFVRALERAYRDMWRRWCCNEPPDSGTVAPGNHEPP